MPSAEAPSPPEQEPATRISTSADSILADSSGTNFRDLFSQFFRGGRREQALPKQEPGSDLEYRNRNQFLGSRARHGKKADHLPPGDLHGVQRHGRGGPAQTCTACGGSGQVAQTSGRCASIVACTRCGGTGRVQAMCRACGGEGRVRRDETIEVRIPAGVQTGSRVRVAGHGNAGTHGAPPGDLYIHYRGEAASLLRPPRRRSLYRRAHHRLRSGAGR